MKIPGKHTTEALEGIKILKFKNVDLQEGGKAMFKIKPSQFYMYLTDSIISRYMYLLPVRERNIRTDCEEFIGQIKVLNSKYWPVAESTEITDKMKSQNYAKGSILMRELF